MACATPCCCERQSVLMCGAAVQGWLCWRLQGPRSSRCTTSGCILRWSFWGLLTAWCSCRCCLPWQGLPRCPRSPSLSTSGILSTSYSSSDFLCVLTANVGTSSSLCTEHKRNVCVTSRLRAGVHTPYPFAFTSISRPSRSRTVEVNAAPKVWF